jgi:hypothetical protein
MNLAATALQGVHRLGSISKLGWALMSSLSRDNAKASNDSHPRKLNHITPECETSIQSVIESEIIPRLLRSQSLSLTAVSDAQDQGRHPNQFEIEAFVSMCIAEEPLLANAYVQQMMAEGTSQETIFLQLITPAARLLGQQWDDGLIDFIEVTHGLVRLQSITHEIGYANQGGPLVSGDVKRIMIASAPGSEHLLGPSIVTEFFRKEGWQVVLEVSPSALELEQSARREWFDAIGLSISIQSQLEGLGDLVQRIRKSSLNPRTVIMLGGPIFTVMDLKASDFGVDGISTDAQQAVVLALSLQPDP